MNMKRISLLACAVLLLALAPIASAADGVTLINQATASRGLPGCAAQPAFLITICQPGSYELSGNLDAQRINGIAIEASNVTLDLNGFTVSGTGGFGIGVGIDANGEPLGPAVAGATISNGTITGFENGIYGAELSGLSFIRSLDVQVNNFGLLLNGGNAQVQNVFVGANTGLDMSSGLVSESTINARYIAISIVQGPAEITGNMLNVKGGSSAGAVIESAGNANLVGNEIQTSTGSPGILITAGKVAMGHNQILTNGPVSGGAGTLVSMGDNVCNGSRC